MPIKAPTITDLDDSQRAVVKHIPYDDSMFVNGPPGSGKTHVAILRLNVLLNNGYTNVLFLLYNHSMYGFLRSVFNKMNLKTSVDINTKDIFFTKVARSKGYSLSGESGCDYETSYSQRISYLLKKSDFDRYDIIVIDECQDFSDDEISILRKMTPKIIAVGDLDQKVYSNAPSSYFRTIDNKKLSTIYRYGKKIARIAQAFSDSGNNLENQVSITNDTDVYRVRANNDQDGVDKICRILEAKKSTDMTVGIFTLSVSKLKTLKMALQSRGQSCFYAENNMGMRDYNFDTSEPILITPFSAKGMEFDCVILYGYDSLLDWGFYKDKQKQIIYVSLTRTSNELYLIDQPGTHPLLRNMQGLVDMDTQRIKKATIDEF